MISNLTNALFVLLPSLAVGYLLAKMRYKDQIDYWQSKAKLNEYKKNESDMAALSRKRLDAVPDAELIRRVTGDGEGQRAKPDDR